MRFRTVVLLAAALFAAGCGSNGASSNTSPSTAVAAPNAGSQDDESTGAEAAAPGETVEWEDARVFIEYNSEGGDYGFHAEFGSEPWSTATIAAPDGEVLFELSAAAALAEHGMSGVFFESAEFPLEKLPLDDFLERFPEGDYTFTGTTVDGRTLVGESAFTHLIPEPPEITEPELGAEVDPDEIVVSWDPVTEPEGIEIEVYTVQLSPVDPPEGQDPIALNIDYTFEVPSTIGQIRLLPELFQPGSTYTFELMAIAVDEGNQSFSVGEFTIEDDPAELDPADFTASIDNPYLPLPVGAQWEYEVTTADGGIERLEIEVLADEKNVIGIETTAVKATLFVDDEIEEITVARYAQDDDGNVWLLGEVDEGYADGELVETFTWEAGTGPAQPGIIMPGEAELGEEFRIDFLIDADGAVTDRGRVVSEDETVEVTAGRFREVRLIETAGNVQPHLIERKHYAPGVGLVFEDSPVPETDEVVLVSFTVPGQ